MTRENRIDETNTHKNAHTHTHTAMLTNVIKIELNSYLHVTYNSRLYAHWVTEYTVYIVYNIEFGYGRLTAKRLNVNMNMRTFFFLNDFVILLSR